MPAPVVDWTPERVDLLKKLVAQKAPTWLMMKQIGAPSRNIIHGKMFRLGLRRAKPAERPNGKKHAFSPVKKEAAVKSPPLAPTMPEILPNPLGRHGPPQCSIMGLRWDTCRWPLGAFAERAKLYCGEQTLLGCVYCATHASIAFVA